MKILNLTIKLRAIFRIAAVGAVATMASCGGGGGGSTEGAGTNAIGGGTITIPGVTNPVPGGTNTAAPAFNLKGFVYCGKQGDTKDFKVKTHVAF